MSVITLTEQMLAKGRVYVVNIRDLPHDGSNLPIVSFFPFPIGWLMSLHLDTQLLQQRQPRQDTGYEGTLE